MQERQLCFHIIWATLSKYYICHFWHLHSQFVPSGFIFWFFFTWFSDNQIWFGTRREAKISFSSTRHTCFPLLDITYPQETLFGDFVLRTTPLPTTNSLIPLLSSHTKILGISVWRFFSWVDIRLFSPPMQTKSSLLLPPHLAVECLYLGSCLSYTHDPG